MHALQSFLVIVLYLHLTNLNLFYIQCFPTLFELTWMYINKEINT
jgi:hypothetical protein